MHRPQNACYYNKCSSRGALQRTIETRIHRPVTCSRFSHSTIDSILIFQLRLRCCPQSSASFHRFNYSHSLYRGGENKILPKRNLQKNTSYGGITVVFPDTFVATQQAHPVEGDGEPLRTKQRSMICKDLTEVMSLELHHRT